MSTLLTCGTNGLTTSNEAGWLVGV